ncbi:bifunctional N-acetylglucosamine-1-phosphate uridyltransferase/glucosamine-1-phosphate acetyltransferase [bacterium]|nr:bifunctional N-acetylglucosamine-1-phosphate uridyltransferase/glucosamine-1-phosphate acetyltransferase [bacterium]
MSRLAAIVLAAGKSKRMNSALPKVLHPILGMPLVCHVLEAAVAAGVRRIVVVASVENRSALEAALREWHDERARRTAPSLTTFSVDVVVQEVQRGTADAVLSARARLQGFDGTAVVLCGDAPCVSASSIEALLSEHRSKGAEISVLSGELDDPGGYGRIVRGSGAAITRIVEEKDATPDERRIREINSGIIALEVPLAWSLLENVAPSKETDELYLTEAVSLASREGRKALAVMAAVPEDVLGVNDRAQLAHVTAVIRRRVNLAHMKAGVTLVDPDTVFIDPRARIGRDTLIMPFVVIEGPCVIGSGVRLGPFAHVRGGSVLGDGGAVGNFVEVVRTRMGSSSRALHLAYLGDATVGEGTNVGAGTIFANYDGKDKHPTSVGAKVSLGAGTVLVAPCSVGDSARTGAGAVVLARESVPAGETWVGVPARKNAARRASLGEDKGGEVPHGTR